MARVYTLAKLYTKRHKEYATLMLDVAKHLVEGHCIHRALVQQAEAKLHKQAMQARHVQYSPLSYPGIGSCSKFKHVVHVCRFPRIMQQHQGIQHVEHFLMHIPVVPSGQTIRGITWLELYAIYRLCGYPKGIPNENDRAMAKPSLAQQMVHFKKCCRRAINASFAQSAALCFAPCNNDRQQLEGLAIGGRHPAVSFNVCLSEDG